MCIIVIPYTLWKCSLILNCFLFFFLPFAQMNIPEFPLSISIVWNRYMKLPFYRVGWRREAHPVKISHWFPIWVNKWALLRTVYISQHFNIQCLISLLSRKMVSLNSGYVLIPIFHIFPNMSWCIWGAVFDHVILSLQNAIFFFWIGFWLIPYFGSFERWINSRLKITPCQSFRQVSLYSHISQMCLK